VNIFRKYRFGIPAFIIIWAIIASGCSANNTGAYSREQSPAENKNQEIRICLGNEPLTLDPALFSGDFERCLVSHLFEGLTCLDENMQVSAGVAESWRVASSDEDGEVYIFTLRENCRWSDSAPLTAEDFVYAWRRAASPETGSPYAELFHALKNGKEVSLGTLPPEDLGVRALDSRTLEVTLEGPCAFFTSLLAHPAFSPVSEKAVKKSPYGWTNTPESFVSNGRYCLENWEHDIYILLSRSEEYRIEPEEESLSLRFLLMNEQECSESMLKEELDFAVGSDEETVTLQTADEKALAVVQVPSGGSIYYCFNCKTKPFDDPLVREAFAIVVDFEKLSAKIREEGFVSTSTIVPEGARAGAALFDEDGALANPEGTYFGRIARALELLEEAGYEDASELGEIVLLTNDMPIHSAVTSILAESWEKAFRIKVTLQKEEYKEFEKQRAQGDFSVVKAGIKGELGEPYEYLVGFLEGEESKFIGKVSQAFKQDMAVSKWQSNQQLRSELLADAQQTLLREDWAAMPICRSSQTYIISKKLLGVSFTPTGIPSFAGAQIK